MEVPTATTTAVLVRPVAHDTTERLPVAALQKIATLAGVLLPVVGLIAAIVLLWGWGMTWVELTLFVVMYLLAGLGVTVGYHRLFTHRSFETVWPVKFALAVFGSMAVQGPLLKWAAVHRRHHQHSDEPEDPHSPHGHGGGVKGVILGFWHAHVGWIFKGDPSNLRKYVRDLYADRSLRVASNLFGLWVALGLLVPAALGLWITGTWMGALLGFLWGGLARVFFGHHATWSVNSICHMWGKRPFAIDDESRNNFIFGVLALGEGWHNNHHAFPASARHGLRWWQFDLSWLVIRGLELCGLARRVRLPSDQALMQKRLSAS